MTRGRRVRQYLLGEEFARGGIGTVHLAKHIGDRGFARVVAVKMLHPRFAASSYYTRALEQEARLAARIRDAHVVQSIDVVADGSDLLLVMEYVDGVSLATLLAEAGERNERLPAAVTASILHDALLGLDAAHEARDEKGRALGIVHRDVSPQNILVGADGIAKLTDFGIARAVRDDAGTASGAVLGKQAYMPPEQRRGLPVGRQADLFAAAVVLGEALTGKNSPADEDAALAWRQEIAAELEPAALGDLFRVATRAAWTERYASAGEMAAELARILPPAGTPEVRRVLVQLAGDILEIRAEQVAAIEALTGDAADEAPAPPPREAKAELVVHTEAMPAAEKHPIVATAPLPAASRTVPPPPPATPPAPQRRVGRVALGGAAVLLASLVLVFAAVSRSGARSARVEERAPDKPEKLSPIVASAIPSASADPPVSVASPPAEPPSGSSTAPTRTAPRPRGHPAPPARPVVTTAPSTAPPAPPATPSVPRLDPSGSRI